MFVEVGSGVPSGTARWTPASVLADPDAGPAPLPRGANLQGPCRAPPASPARGGSHRGRRPCARVSPCPAAGWKPALRRSRRSRRPSSSPCAQRKRKRRAADKRESHKPRPAEPLSPTAPSEGGS